MSERTYLKDYTPPAYLADSIDLAFDIFDEKTSVKAVTRFRRNPKAPGNAPLVLNGADLKLISMKIDGAVVEPAHMQVEGETLTITNVPDHFTLSTETEIDPAHNSSLEGLYASGPMLCTQCEAEGFRRITYFPDRPDVLSRFSASITAEKEKFPVLLSNGNPLGSDDMGSGRCRVRWQDPFPKPCYLFALVAGKLEKIEETFTTLSGRKVLLQIYCETGKENQLTHAMESLKKAMRWDEQRFGREYDLDRFMIVATPFFNSGAMENKGLNIFNDAYLLGTHETATDRDLYNIESVVAHEYFHNWSGDRVTCRDWFQLSLKEGFTVFRDQEFSSDMHSSATERIANVRGLRNHQFPEDAGPMAHPVRPDSYLTIDNFYTMTVYEKGAEVVRMLQTLFGSTTFRKGTDLYFSRHDGQAVTCDDFVAAIFDANSEDGPGMEKKIDSNQFKRWYAQAGTPRITAKTAYDAANKRFILSLSQHVPSTPGQPAKQLAVIPVTTALLGKNGKELQPERVLILNQASQDFVFDNVGEPPALSLLRDFSAPVIIERETSDAELAFLAAHDSNGFNRWDALQTLAMQELMAAMTALKNKKPPQMRADFEGAFKNILATADKDEEFAALCLQLPGEAEIGQALLRKGGKIDPDIVHAAREFLRRKLAEVFKTPFLAFYHARTGINPAATDSKSMAGRMLKNICLAYLGVLDAPEFDQLAFDQAHTARCMTDSVNALAVLARREADLRVKAFAHFFEKWHAEKLVIDKWFSLQATADRKGVLKDVQNLMLHSDFNIANPNMVYAVVRGFTGNLPHFHDSDGSGYRFLADVVLKLDGMNPQIAGRILPPLIRASDYDDGRAAKMRAELGRILNTPSLSKNVREVAEAGLEKADA